MTMRTDRTRSTPRTRSFTPAPRRPANPDAVACLWTKPWQLEFLWRSVRCTSREREEARKASPHSASTPPPPPEPAWPARSVSLVLGGGQGQDPEGQSRPRAARVPPRVRPARWSAACCPLSGPARRSTASMRGRSSTSFTGSTRVVIGPGMQGQAPRCARRRGQRRIRIGTGVTWRSLRSTSRPSISGRPRSSRMTSKRRGFSERISSAGNPGCRVSGGNHGCVEGGRHGVVVLDDEHIHGTVPFR